jgi:hypothetical protein
MNKNLMFKPMSGEEMLKYNPDSHLYKYSDIYHYKTIDDLFGHLDKIILLYLMESLDTGHWVCLIRNKKLNSITFFDSYGLKPDEEEKFAKKTIRDKTGENYKYLFYLLTKSMIKSNYKIYINPYKLQGPGSFTCGRFCSLRLLEKNLSNKEFYNKYFSGKIPDKIICEIIK